MEKPETTVECYRDSGLEGCRTRSRWFVDDVDVVDDVRG